MAAAVRTTVANWTTTSGTKNVSIGSTAIGDIPLIICGNTGNVNTPTVTDNNGDGLGTYTLITSALKATSADKLFAFIRDAQIGVTASTVFSCAIGATTGGGATVIMMTGVTAGAAGVRQSGKQENQAAATPAPAFETGAPLTTSLCVGGIFNATNPATMTVPASWTERSDVGYATPDTGFEGASDTGVTLQTITWGSASATEFCSLIVEIKVAAAGSILRLMMAYHGG
jgi:hypothetical protein